MDTHTNVKLRVAPSAVHGEGLFTDTDIQGGHILTTGIIPGLFCLAGKITHFG